MTLQHRSLAQDPFRIPEVELVLPSGRVELREFQRWRDPMIQQTRTQPQFVPTKSLARDLYTNLPNLDVVVDAPRPALLPHIEPDAATPVGQLRHEAGLDMARHTEQEVTADPPARRPDVDHHARHAIQAIGEQQGAVR